MFKWRTWWNANWCYSLRTTCLIFETFKIPFPTASFYRSKRSIHWATRTHGEPGHLTEFLHDMRLLLPAGFSSEYVNEWWWKLQLGKYLRNRKHVPCFYRVIQTRVEVWENEKCCGNTSRRRVFPQLFRVLPNFHECLYNSIETWSTCFLFLLENTTTRKRKTPC